MPKASIIITTHNRPQLLPCAVSSARESGTDVEIVVVDDASGANANQMGKANVATTVGSRNSTETTPADWAHLKLEEGFLRKPMSLIGREVLFLGAGFSPVTFPERL